MKKTLITIFAAAISLSGYAQAVKPIEGDTLYLKSAEEFEKSINRFVECMDTLVVQGDMYDAYKLKLRRRFRDFMKLHGNDDEGVKLFKSMYNALPARFVLNYFEEAGENVKSRLDLYEMAIVPCTKKVRTDAPLSIVNYNKFVDFSVDYDGKTQKLSDYVGNGKYALVNFWSSWSNSSLQEIPYIKAAQEKYGSENIVFLGVATSDKPEDTKRAIDELCISWPQIMNAKGDVLDIYGISGMSEVMFFSPEGNILARSLSGKLIDAILKKYFPQPVESDSESDFFGFAALVQYETTPKFPGGDDAMKDFIKANLKYPAKAKAEGKEGLVGCFATIEPDGSIKDIKVVESLDDECDREAMRVIGLMPEWTPGTCCGDVVDEEIYLPIHFDINDK